MEIGTTLKHYAHCLPDAQEAAARAADLLFLTRPALAKDGRKVIAPFQPHGGTEQGDTSP